MLDNVFIHFLTHNKLRWARHGLLIAIFASIFLLQNGGMQVDTGTGQGNASLMLWLNTFSFVCFLLVIYINNYLLVPNYLVKRLYTRYIGLISCIITAFFSLIYFFDRFYIAKTYQTGTYSGLSATDLIGFAFFTGLILAAVTSIKLFQLWILNNYRISELEKNNLKTELAQLKSQINPHFLFNVLNNINILIRKDAISASAMVFKLSDLLKYQLYESRKEKIFLTDDIRFLSNILELEKSRRDRFDYSVLIDGAIKDLLLPPFLFIAFVENATKHNVCTDGPSFVRLSFQVKDDKLVFKCINSVPEIPVAQTQASGIGLKNISRRLELLYPGVYDIKAGRSGDQYIVKLELPL